MTTLADKAILSGADNRPPMLEKDMYDSWKSRMELYMMNRQHGRMILESVENGPLIWPSIEENGVTRPKKYSELSATEAIQADCDIKATNIILQGLPPEVYALVSNHKVTKELWERIQLLMQGTSLTKQERECKLYDEFDKFAYKKGETLREFYLRFSLLLNDMNIYNMKLEQFQVNTKFLNTLPPEWSKFVTDVKLVRDLHTTNYIKHTQEETIVLRDLVEHVKSKYPLDQSLESTCRYAKLVQELLTNISNTCPSINNADGKLVAVTPKNKDKSVRFTKPITSSGNTITKTTSTSNLVSNKPVLSSTGVKPFNSASGSQPSGNTKKDKIRQTPSSTQKNKVEAHPRKVKSSLKNKDCVVESKGTAHVQHSRLNANSEVKCVKCNGCMLSANHDLCVLDFINNVNARNKSKSVKKNSKKKVWKPTGKVFTNIGYIWRPTGRTFTIVGNACHLTRITTTTEVPHKKPTALENETPKPVVTLIYSKKPRKSKTNGLDNKTKVPKSVSANKKEPNQSRGSKVSNVPSSSLIECMSSKFFSIKFGNDHVAKILGYGDYQIGNDMISRVYYVEGLVHNLFLVGQFCDSNLEVAFRQHTCFIRNLEGVDLLTGSRGNNLYTLSLGDMMASSPICLLTDNGTEFVNQTLCEYYEKVGISHETSVARSPQQNGVVERQNRTLIEAARTMLIYAKALLFLWVEAVATAYFDELTAMASEHSSSGPALHEMTPATISSGLVPNPPPSTLFVPPSRTDWDMLFQPLFDELLNPPPSVDHPAPEVVAPIDEVAAPEPAVSTGSPSSTTVDQDAPSPNFSKVQWIPHCFIAETARNTSGMNYLLMISSLLESSLLNFVEKSKLDEDKKGKAVDPSHYRGMIGTLLYLIARLWYLKDSLIALTTFGDADHVGCQIPVVAHLGSMQLLGDRTYSWSSKSRQSIAISSMEAVYIALSCRCCAQSFG
ncbi:retrovirus-related pol polyprotein from transposon TNT 1-94 [Tanacetum coccineum]|uniref:Retrovirus-related pol polyprotein from transposon TNT 1-94 n=1 Tax=Tanacetum coccineum TaxID=301880 RepID=A0ABQ5AY16_9ASTR